MKHIRIFEDFQTLPNSISISLLDPKFFDAFGRSEDGVYPHLDALLSPKGLQMIPGLYYPVLKMGQFGWIYLLYNDQLKDIVLIRSKEHGSLSPDLGIGIENQKRIFPDEGVIDNTYEELEGVDLNPAALPQPGSGMVKYHHILDGTKPGSTALPYGIRGGQKYYMGESPIFKVS